MHPRIARFTRTVLAIALGAAVTGCALQQPRPIVHQPMTAKPPAVPAVPATNGAIFQAANGFRPLFEDRRAMAVGDTLTVTINEKTAASKTADSTANRAGSASLTVPLVAGLPGKSFQGAGLTAKSGTTFEGKGGSSATNDFTGTITCTVVEVLPNGNLIVSGEKQIAINQGEEFIRFSGVVNPATIVSGNTVSSTQVADARIEYKGHGYIDEAQTMGWLQRFFNNVLPF